MTSKHKTMRHFLLCTAVLSFVSVLSYAQEEKKTPESTEIWEPQPKIVTPGETPSSPPSDAIVLFDGKDLDQWTSLDGSPAKWPVKDGAFTVAPGTKDIKTKRDFGDMQLHIEWKTPPVTDPSKVSQARGNSGIFLQDRYEVQVLDNYENKTYANGQAGSIYKQHIPLANACKKPGEWQVYDIVYTAPRFDNDGRVMIPAYVTVIHNGVLVLNHVAIWGPTQYIGYPVYVAHGKAPIHLQDHHNAVSYRNIWLREL
jgi:3-keto-disaccharide hydrolase